MEDEDPDDEHTTAQPSLRPLSHQPTPEELEEMGMTEMAQKLREIQAENANKNATKEGTPANKIETVGKSMPGRNMSLSLGCDACRQVVNRMEVELNIKDMREVNEVSFYLDEICDDMEYYYKDWVVKWCRANIPKNKMMISGLLQMIPKNFEETVCVMSVHACTNSELGITKVDASHPNQRTKQKRRKKRKRKKAIKGGSHISRNEL